VEQNDTARASHECNFRPRAPADGYVARSDITRLTGFEAVRHLARQQPAARECIDVVIGGPPCQAFSRLGRAALWDIAGNKHAHVDDPRATLYEHFLSYVEDLHPIAFVMENVPEIGRFHRRNVAEEIALAAKDLGYETRYALLNAVWYGVPQFRERMIIIGIRRELKVIPGFPPRTHEAEIPIGYLTSRAGHHRAPPVLGDAAHFVDHAERTAERIRAGVTVEQAFRDLPEILLHLDRHAMQNGGRALVRDLDRDESYRSPKSAYSDRMRNWPGFSSNGESRGHVIRLTPRDYRIFRKMRPGDMYPQAVAIAEELFAQAVELADRRGRTIGRRSAEWEQLRRKIVPPYKLERFVNKFRKMDADEPARTVPAHLGKDCYSHIHPDSSQARTISVREAARLQSFPDAFVFSGTMNEQFTQIGNAVPPLMAAAISRHLRFQLRLASRRLGV
jgi:DNA (cytosine-5)-methyltransferase 1